MGTMITRTRAELRAAAMEARDAGATTTQILQTVAWMLTQSAATPEEFERNVANVSDMASFWFDELSDTCTREQGFTPYPWETATFDDLTGRDQAWVVGRVIEQFGDPDVAPRRPAQIRLADHLLDGLRKTAALRVEYGSTYDPVYSSIYTTLLHLLRRHQSLHIELAAESIDQALTSGKSIAESISLVIGTRIAGVLARTDGQL